MIIRCGVIVIHIFRVFANYYVGYLEIGLTEEAQTKMFTVNIRICVKDIVDDYNMLVSLWLFGVWDGGRGQWGWLWGPIWPMD